MILATIFRLKISTSRYTFVFAFVITLIFLNSLTFAQSRKLVPIASVDTVNTGSKDTINTANKDTSSFKIAKGSLEGDINYKATDSIVYDAKTKQFYLYNNANVKYQDIELGANYVCYNMDSSAMTAHNLAAYVTDTSEYSTFKQGDQLVGFDTLQYNFKSQRALVQNAHNSYDDGFIISKQTKRNKDNSIYGLNNIYTTCSLDEPHFGIYSKKIKVIPGVMGISGPAQFVIEGIPTPLYLPFGIFPLSKGQHAGFILPSQTFNANLGFGLVGGGYYFPINDYIHVIATADIYSYGTYNIGINSSYIKRYKYNGNFNINYSLAKLQSTSDASTLSTNTFKINWSHRVDPKALNGGSFSASIDAGSSNYNKINYASTQTTTAYLQNQMNSNISYGKSWAGKPFNFSISARHSQDNNTRLFTITLPSINFSINSIQPLLRKNSVGPQRWFEKIRFNYTFEAQNNYSFYDTAFSAKNITFRNMNNGVKQVASLGADYKFLKYFNLNLSANYNEYWNTKKSFKYYDPTINGVDTIKQYGFFTARDYNAAATIGTNIYGTKLFKKGVIRGIRHTITPNLSFNYHPDFGTGIYNNYYSTFLDKYYTQRRISYYDGNIYTGPPDGKNGSVGFNINNVLSFKFLNKKDTTNPTKKINILEALGIGTSYNLAVDSFQWSDIHINYTTAKLFNRISLSGGANYSPYAWNYASKSRSPVLQINTNGKLARFTTSNLSLGADFKNKDSSKRKTPNETVNIPWTLNISLSATSQQSLTHNTLQDSMLYSIGTTYSGTVKLTPKWSIKSSSGYDFINKKMSYTTIGIIRDLHCWEMSFDFAPFSTAYGRYYSFTLHPKSNILKDLKVTKKQYYNQY